MRGVFAATPTPIHDDGRLNEAAFDRLLEWTIDAGVDGICVGGATSEYPHFEIAEREAVIRRAARRLPRDRALLVGIGASSMRRSIELGRVALEAGSRALLLPMPMFFRYAQQDLEAYCAHVSGTLRGPCLLYDLPEFTNGLAPPTALALLRGEEFIVGIKDSSGRRERLAIFSEAREPDWTLLVGDDRLLVDGLAAGWDGGISGVAAFCPELLVALYRSVSDGRRDDTSPLLAALEELIERMSVFPAPWGVRIGLAARGIDTGPLPLPLTTERRQQIRDFQEWFNDWVRTLSPGESRRAARRPD